MTDDQDEMLAVDDNRSSLSKRDRLKLCRVGKHGHLVDGKPKFHGRRSSDPRKDGCVNISRFCPDCGAHVREVSWARTAWEKEQEKCRKLAMKLKGAQSQPIRRKRSTKRRVTS